MNDSTPRPDPITFSRRTRARIAHALACQGLSNSARASVPTASDGYAVAGAMVEETSLLVAAAEHILELAVIVERERGTTWDEIGSSLDISADEARERFAPVMTRWRAALIEPWVPSGRLLSLQLPDGAEDPAMWSRYLDEWVIRHQEPTDPAHGSLPVSGHLEAAGLVEQVTHALAELEALRGRERTRQGTPEQRYAWLRRKSELFDRLAEANPDDLFYAEAARRARFALAMTRCITRACS